MVVSENLNTKNVKVIPLNYDDDWEEWVQKNCAHGKVKVIANRPLYYCQYVGIVIDEKSGELQDCRFAAGYTPDTEIQKDGTSWCLYGLGNND